MIRALLLIVAGAMAALAYGFAWLLRAIDEAEERARCSPR
jgi:hypothetical protein